MKEYENRRVRRLQCPKGRNAELSMILKELNQLDQAQLLNYLKIVDMQVGLLLNFNSLNLVKGMKRIVNNLKE